MLSQLLCYQLKMSGIPAFAITEVSPDMEAPRKYNHSRPKKSIIFLGYVHMSLFF